MKPPGSDLSNARRPAIKVLMSEIGSFATGVGQQQAWACLLCRRKPKYIHGISGNARDHDGLMALPET